jgi:nucleoside-diphosphate-sugar epimerase
VRALLAREREVVAFCRRPEALADLRHPALRVAAGDLRDPASYRELLSPGATVFHLAAVRNHPRSCSRAMEEVNVQATLALARAAGERGTGRLVHAATALIYGPSGGGEVRTERDPLDAGSLYARSKAEAVRGLCELVRQGLRAVTVCPSIVYGPDSPGHPNRVTSEIRRLLKGGPRIWIGGGGQRRDLVFVDDVVQGMLAAEERGGVGEEYLLTGEEVSPRELAGRVLALAGARAGWVLPLPAAAARAAAGIADRLLGRSAGSGYAAAVQTLLSEWRFSSGKARRDLGYQPVALREGLRRTVDWLQGIQP